MTAIDHSVLIFFLDAIEKAPSKATDLLVLASRRESASEDFRSLVNWAEKGFEKPRGGSQSHPSDS